MPLSPLTAISPVDGRYRRAVEALAGQFSESALIRYRVRVEIEYFIALCELPLPPLAAVDRARFEPLRSIYRDFSLADAEAVKAIEGKTNHDVKAVEYFLKERFEALGLGNHKEFIHFGLTSQDINNTAIPLSLRDAWTTVVGPLFDEVATALRERVQEWKDVPLLARTHGQPASPTGLGKEIQVFVERLEQQRVLLAAVPFSGKFGGATGNFNAHLVAYPEVDWPAFADRLVNEVLGLKRCRVTTQIEPYDNLAAFCDGLKRLNTILLDFDRDIWTYVAMGYFRQKINKGEVGSSTMPHKVNPIDFENSEGNLGVANALLAHLAAKLPISRLQRDLTDSTVTRNIGVPLAHTVIALKSLLRGLAKLLIDTETIKRDLEANWAVVTEGIQTVLRRVGYPNPYEALKALARTNKPIDRAMIQAFIDELDVDDTVKAELKAITPLNYTGVPLV
ncbi:MAG: adenylosuccinate lyase [Desulfosarcina sp.]|nr:adenylosuccinate lyase [Desulfobacterales bacterium]